MRVPITGKVVFSKPKSKTAPVISDQPDKIEIAREPLTTYSNLVPKVSVWGLNHAVANYADTQQCPQIARDNNNNLFAVYEFRYTWGGFPCSEVWCSKSADGGSTWEVQFSLWDNAYNYYNPSIAITDDNQYFIAYQTDDTLGFQYLNSPDGDKWYQYYIPDWKDVYPYCLRPQVAVHGTGPTTQILMAWQYYYSGTDNDIGYAVSADDGNNWVLSENGIAASAYFESNPTVAISDTCMGVAYEYWSLTTIPTDSVDIMYRHNNGLTADLDTIWQAAIYGIGTYHQDKYPDMTASQNKMYLTCQTPYNAQTDYDIRVRISNDGGKSFTVPPLTEGFDGVGVTGTPVPAGWSFSGITSTYTTATNYGVASPSIKFDNTNDSVTTPVFPVADSLRYWIKGQGTDANSKLVIRGYNGSGWVTIDSVRPLPTTGTIKRDSLTFSTITQLRFIYTKSVGNLAFDDVYVKARSTYVTAYNAHPAEETYPAITCSDTTVHLAFFTNGNQVGYGVSHNAGFNWESPVIINDSTAAVAQRCGVDLCFSQGDPRIVWTDRRNADVWGLAYDVYFNTSNRSFPHTCDLMPYPLTGWSGPLVPSKNCSIAAGDTVVSDTLRGLGSTNRDTTYIRATFQNNSAVDVADSFYFGIFVDEWWDAIWVSPGLPAGYYFDLLDTTKVFGGRHTLSSRSDYDARIWYEGNRANNDFYGQWVWTPSRMPDDTTMILSAAPQPSYEGGKFAEYNCDGFYQTTTNYWSAVAVKPDSGGSAELRLYTDGYGGSSTGFSKTYSAAESFLGADSVDIVAVDGNALGSGVKFYPGVYRQAGTIQTDYRAQFCLQDGTCPSTGYSARKYMGTTQLVHTFDVSLTQGTTYWAACSLAVGPASIGFAVFSPKGANYKSRSQAACVFNNITGPGNQLSFVADTTGWFSIVAWHNTAGKNDTALYRVGINTTPFALPLAVALSSFSAQAFCDSVVLQWRTESETNTYQWLIERSNDGGEGYAELDRIPAAGSTANPTRYRWTDRTARPGAVYSYRIGELDSDGKLAYYGPVQVQAALRSGAAGQLLQPRPNPFGHQVALTYQVTAASRVRIAVYNVAGQLVRTIVDQHQIPGVYVAQWDGKDAIGRGTPAGCYFLNMAMNGNQTLKKIVKVQ